MASFGCDCDSKIQIRRGGLPLHLWAGPLHDASCLGVICLQILFMSFLAFRPTRDRCPLRRGCRVIQEALNTKASQVTTRIRTRLVVTAIHLDQHPTPLKSNVLSTSLVWDGRQITWPYGFGPFTFVFVASHSSCNDRNPLGVASRNSSKSWIFISPRMMKSFCSSSWPSTQSAMAGSSSWRRASHELPGWA